MVTTQQQDEVLAQFMKAWLRRENAVVLAQTASEATAEAAHDELCAAAEQWNLALVALDAAGLYRPVSE